MSLDLKEITADAARWRKNLEIACDRLGTARRKSDENENKDAVLAALTNKRAASSTLHALDCILFLAGVRKGYSKRKRKKPLTACRRRRRKSGGRRHRRRRR